MRLYVIIFFHKFKHIKEIIKTSLDFLIYVMILDRLDFQNFLLYFFSIYKINKCIDKLWKTLNIIQKKNEP